MIRFKLTLPVLLFLLSPAIVFAQSLLLQQKDDIYAIVKDLQGNRSEGYLQIYPQEITVSTEDNKEKSIPLRMIESIKLEKSQKGLPGADKLGESYYSVRLHNSQEVFTLQKKYTFSLNASVGVLIKNIDPDVVKTQKNSPIAAKSEGSPSFIQDKSVILSLELKF